MERYREKHEEIQNITQEKIDKLLENYKIFTKYKYIIS